MISFRIADESDTASVANLLAALFEEVEGSPDAEEIAGIFAIICMLTASLKTMTNTGLSFKKINLFQDCPHLYTHYRKLIACLVIISIH